MIKDTVVMLSEHPNVRVHNDPLRMYPAREVTALAGTAKRRGGFLGGTLSLPRKKGYEKSFEDSGCRIGVRHDRALRTRGSASSAVDLLQGGPASLQKTVDALRGSTLHLKNKHGCRTKRECIRDSHACNDVAILAPLC